MKVDSLVEGLVVGVAFGIAVTICGYLADIEHLLKQIIALLETAK